MVQWSTCSMAGSTGTDCGATAALWQSVAPRTRDVVSHRFSKIDRFSVLKFLRTPFHKNEFGARLYVVWRRDVDHLPALGGVAAQGSPKPRSAGILLMFVH